MLTSGLRPKVVVGGRTRELLGESYLNRREKIEVFRQDALIGSALASIREDNQEREEMDT